MPNPITSALQDQSNLLGEAAKQMFSKPVDIQGSLNQARVAFKEGSTSNKLTVLGGISTGMTFTLNGLRNLRNGITRDERTGKRDLASAALGLAETAGGVFVTALFWERMKMMDGVERCEDSGHSR